MFKTEHKVGEFSANVGLTESLTSLDIVIVIIQATQNYSNYTTSTPEKYTAAYRKYFNNILTKSYLTKN